MSMAEPGLSVKPGDTLGITTTRWSQPVREAVMQGFRAEALPPLTARDIYDWQKANGTVVGPWGGHLTKVRRDLGGGVRASIVRHVAAGVPDTFRFTVCRPTSSIGRESGAVEEIASGKALTEDMAKTLADTALAVSGHALIDEPSEVEAA